MAYWTKMHPSQIRSLNFYYQGFHGALELAGKYPNVDLEEFDCFLSLDDKEKDAVRRQQSLSNDNW